MPKIVKLNNQLSNLIAAGEVVVNMASVVKELVENSIDANSTIIKIDLMESGLEEIKVTDNGHGMDKEDIKLSIERHATSKIKTSNDLFHLSSLGFRGEALPSIASVSHLEIASNNGDNGYYCLFKNGLVVDEGLKPINQGTVISVKYLFYNTPARLKHLKGPNIELSYISEYINKIALSHPEIAFTLSNNNKQLFSTTKSDSPLRVLSNIYSLEIIKNMVYFQNENQYFHIEGYLAKPLFNRSSRNHITVIANKRMIKNNEIISSVIDAFKTYLPIKKYPIVYLNITLDPLLIDVNVHPQKLEVKFTESRLLKSLIKNTISESLKSLLLIPEIKEYNEPSFIQEEIKLSTSDPEFKSKVIKEDLAKFLYNKIDKKIESTKEPLKTEVESAVSRIPKLEYIGQYVGTYLLAQENNNLYIVDQHAAAERVRYENYYQAMSNKEVNTYELLIPITLDLSNSEVINLQGKFNLVNKFGVRLKNNSNNTIDITHVPSWFFKGYERVYTEEILKYVLEDKDVSLGDIIDDLAKSLSCKHSIKANKFINQNEIQKLFFDLEQCDNPYMCPHGRPTIIKFTLNEIEKMFKRVM